MKAIEQMQRVEEIVNSKVGDGKEFATPQDALDYCNRYIEALGPLARIGGGVWGIKFSLLIPELESHIERTER